MTSDTLDELSDDLVMIRVLLEDIDELAAADVDGAALAFQGASDIINGLLGSLADAREILQSLDTGSKAR